MNNQPTISILMPVKNALPFLTDCLDSIIFQTYTNWELIAVNDNSTDESFFELRAYAKIDSRIKCVNNKKHGIIDALKLAYTLSSGTYITRMDADDIMTPNKLEVLINGLIKNGKGYIAVGQVEYFSETLLGDGYRSYEQWLNKLTASGENYSEIYKECVIPSPCWMVHKTDLENCNAFDSDWYPEDYDLCFRFYEHGLKCIPCQEIIHLWRDYSHRTSRTHVNYADNQFTLLKCHYFKKINFLKERTLILWGAGNRGKAIAKNLLELGIEFVWVCNNPNKIGHTIYNQTLQATSSIDYKKQMQIIVSVANKAEQLAILSIFKNSALKPMEDYFFFC